MNRKQPPGTAPVATPARDNKPAANQGGSAPLPLPHDRDESAAEQSHPVDATIDQARKDIEQGLRDTDLRCDAAKVFDDKWTGRKRS